MDPDGFGDGVPLVPSGIDVAFTAFPFIFGFVALIVLAGFVVVIVIAVRNYSAVKAKGHDPFTLQADLAARALDSEMLAPKRSLDDRLRELDDLHGRGVISDDEHTTARARALAEG